MRGLSRDQELFPSKYKSMSYKLRRKIMSKELKNALDKIEMPYTNNIPKYEGLDVSRIIK